MLFIEDISPYNISEY